MRRRILWVAAALAMVLSSCEREDPITPPGPQPQPSGPEVFSLENPTLRAYLNMLEKMPYRDGDYSYSRIDDYYQLSTSYRKDRPMPVTIQWETAAGSGSQRVYVADNPEFTGAATLSVSGSTVSHDIYNLIPGKHYYWKVTSSDGGELGGGEFITSGRRRFLNIDNVCNVRDLGGIPVQGGARRIKYGILFRGGEMNGYHQDYDGMYTRLSANGKKAILQAGIAADLDLRTAEEAVNITSSPIGDGVDYARFESANTYFYDKCWNSDVYIDAVQWTIDEPRKDRPVLFHCIYGADRTGTLSFLIEALLGADENQLAIDYELTSFSYGLNSPPRRRGPKNELSVYRYRQMVEGLLHGSGTIQEQVRTFLQKKISGEDLDWLAGYLLESV